METRTIGPVPACKDHGELVPSDHPKCGWKEYWGTVKSRILVCTTRYCWRWAVERIALLLFLFVCGCPMKMIERRSGSSASEEMEWREKETSQVDQKSGSQERKQTKKVKKRPVVTSEGIVVTLPSGEPAYEVETEDTQSDTSSLTATEILRKLESTGEGKSNHSESNFEKTTLIGRWKLYLVVGILLVVIVLVVWWGIKRKWLFGWIW